MGNFYSADALEAFQEVNYIFVPSFFSYLWKTDHVLCDLDETKMYLGKLISHPSSSIVGKKRTKKRRKKTFHCPPFWIYFQSSKIKTKASSFTSIGRTGSARGENQSWKISRFEAWNALVSSSFSPTVSSGRRVSRIPRPGPTTSISPLKGELLSN